MSYSAHARHGRPWIQIAFLPAANSWCARKRTVTSWLPSSWRNSPTTEGLRRMDRLPQGP